MKLPDDISASERAIAHRIREILQRRASESYAHQVRGVARPNTDFDRGYDEALRAVERVLLRWEDDIVSN